MYNVLYLSEHLWFVTDVPYNEALWGIFGEKCS